MKVFIPALLFSVSVSAQIKMPTTTDVMGYSKQALEACKEDKSKISGCESYTEIRPLKECLMKNQEKLSDKCKIALKLVK